MNQNIEQKQNELTAQTKTLEMPSSIRMLELSKSYLSSIEKKFGVFLRKLGIEAGNYDGDLSGNITGSEKIFQEKILPLQKKIEKEKGSLKKQDLMMQLTQSVLQARGMDMGEIGKMSREKGKEADFQKASNELLGNEEYKDLEKKLKEQVSKLDDVYTTDNSSQNIDKVNLRQTLSKENQDGAINYKDGKISKESYEKIIANNMEKARQAGIELEVTKDFGTYLELGMQSGTLPVAMMVTPGIKKALPMLPSVIGIGIWARAVSLTQSNQTSSEKAWEGTKLVGETALTIAPITGTYISGKETVEAYHRYKNGTGSMSEVIANGIGTGVSAAFDGVTIFLVATGVGAVPAVGVQALKGAVKEATIGGAKKLFSWVIKEGSEKAAQGISEGVAIKSSGVVKTTIDFVSGKINLVSSAYKELGAVEFAKRAGRQALEDTAIGLWDIVTFRGIRDSKLMSKLPESMKLFEKARKATSGLRTNVVESLEKIGLAKRGSAERIRMRDTAAEFRFINNDAQKYARDDGGASRVEEIDAKYGETKSSKQHEKVLGEIRNIVKDGNADQLDAAMTALKSQDEHLGNSLNVLNKILDKITSLNSGALPKEKVAYEIEMLIGENKHLLSDSLKKYLDGIVAKVKAGESFDRNSGNFILFQTKTSGTSKINEIQASNPKGYEEYQALIKGGEVESKNGYHNNYIKTINELNKILETGNLRGEKLDVFMKKYLEILKEAEHSGWGTQRLENFIGGLSDKIGNGDLKNGYEGIVLQILRTPGFETIGLKFINNLDLSLIHNQDIKQKLIDKTMELIQSNKLNAKEKISLIKTLSYYDEYKTLLHKKFNPSPLDIGMEVNPKKISGNYGILQDLIKSTNSSVGLIHLLKLTKKNDLENQKYITQKIANNINDHTKINPDIGTNTKGYDAFTREQLDVCIKELSKLPDIGDSKVPNFKTNFDTIIQKITGENINDGLSDKALKKITGLLESHEVNVLFCKTYPDYAKHITYNIIDDGKNMSIEYKIRFLEGLEKAGIKNLNMDLLKQKFATHLVRHTDNVSFTTKIELIENFFNNKSIIKDGVEEYASLSKKISESKKTELFKENVFKVEKTLDILLDTERSFSDVYIKDLKNHGDITHYTLIKLDKIIAKGGIVNNKGEMTRSLSSGEIEKLKIVREKVNTALNNYELNLFNLSEYQSKATDNEKVKYLFGKIDEMSGWKFTRGSDNVRDVNRTIVKQLNVIQSNFHVEPHIIDGFLFEILGKSNIASFDIHDKIKLLETLERVGIIKPSVEQKQEYIINMGATTQDLRKNIGSIKKYSKDFEKLLAGGNSVVKELKGEILDSIKASGKELTQEHLNSAKTLKQGVHYIKIEGKIYDIREKTGEGYKKLEQHIRSTLQERVPVEESYLAGKSLTEGIDYIRIDNKIYITEIFPSRYFITRMLEATDIKQKEAYMELVHNKTEFGGKTFREYYNDVSDVKTKIIMSYHDEIKYDSSVIQLLKDNAKKHPELVMYAISKRKDYDLIMSDEFAKNGTGQIDEKIFSQSLTKEYIEKIHFEEKGETGKLSDEEYQKIKYGIEKMFQLQKNPEFKKILIAIRGENLTDEDGKIRKEYEEVLRKYSDTFDYILKEMNAKHTSITELLNSVDGKELMIAVKGFQDKYADKTKNATYIAGENIKTLINLIKDPSFKTLILLGLHTEEEKRKEYRDNYDAANNVKANTPRTQNVNEVNESKATNVGDTRVDFDKIIEPSILNRMKQMGHEKVVQALMTIKENATPKNIIFTLVTAGLMTPKDAPAAEKEIGERWTSSPEYKEYQRLGGEKSAEARAIKEKAVTQITRQVLQPYLESFDVKYKEMMEKKINELPLGLRTLLGNINIRVKEKINPNHTQTEINMLNTFIYQYVKSIKDNGGACISNVDKIISKFGELTGTNIEKKLREIGMNADNTAKYKDDTETRKDINKILESVK